MKRLVIGTRGSRLALVQAQWVKERLAGILGVEWTPELCIIRTTGDKLQKGPVSGKLAKGLFTKELENALLEKRIDLAVHSCKDLPTELDEAFEIGAVPERAGVRDALLLKDGVDLSAIPKGGVILTGSPRRQKQWLWKYPHTVVEPVRGNVETRMRKAMESEPCKGLILAEAGLDRLGADLTGFQKIALPTDEMVPAPGQGALAIEIRKGDEAVIEAIDKLNDPLAHAQVLAERAFLRGMGGGCAEPVGGIAEVSEGKVIRLRGVDFRTGVRRYMEHEGPMDAPERVGEELAGKFKEKS